VTGLHLHLHKTGKMLANSSKTQYIRALEPCDIVPVLLSFPWVGAPLSPATHCPRQLKGSHLSSSLPFSSNPLVSSAPQTYQCSTSQLGDSSKVDQRVEEVPVIHVATQLIPQWLDSSFARAVNLLLVQRLQVRMQLLGSLIKDLQARLAKKNESCR